MVDETLALRHADCAAAALRIGWIGRLRGGHGFSRFVWWLWMKGDRVVSKVVAKWWRKESMYVSEVVIKVGKR